MAGVRNSQAVVETILEPSSGKVRVTQAVVETVLMDNDGKVRITQYALETIAYYVPAPFNRQPNVCVIC